MGRMRLKKPDPPIIREFASVAEFAAHAARVNRDSRLNTDDDWAGGTLEDAVGRASAGWSEGREKICAIADVIRERISPAVARAGLRRSVAAADGVDIGDFAAGRPDCMREFCARPAKKPLRLNIVLDSPGTTSSDCITNRGAALAAAADCLSMAGYAVEIVATSTTAFERIRIAYTIAVKAHGEPCDIDALAFVLANPGMPRRLVFASVSGEPCGDTLRHEGYGYVWYDYTDKTASIYMRGLLRRATLAAHPEVQADITENWESVESSANAMLELLAGNGLAEYSPESVDGAISA